MAVKTDTVTATNLTLTESGASTSLTKPELDELLAQRFTTEEASTLKKLAKMVAIQNLVAEKSPPTYLVHSKTLSGVEKTAAEPETQDEKTLYIVSEGS